MTVTELQKEYNKNYYKKNKEKIAQDYQDNKQQKIIYQKQYNKKNLEKIKEYYKKYYFFFREEYAKYNRIHYRINKDKIKFNRKIAYYKKIYGIDCAKVTYERENKPITLSFD